MIFLNLEKRFPLRLFKKTANNQKNIIVDEIVQITHVAIKQCGIIYSLPAPHRHHDVIRLISTTTNERMITRGPAIQGFLTSEGEFLDRKQAYLLACMTNQIKRDRDSGYQGNSLFSEDLW